MRRATTWESTCRMAEGEGASECWNGLRRVLGRPGESPFLVSFEYPAFCRPRPPGLPYMHLIHTLRDNLDNTDLSRHFLYVPLPPSLRPSRWKGRSRR